jgi:hypothetical protein
MALQVLTWQEISEWLDVDQDDDDRQLLERLAESVENFVETYLGVYRFGTVNRSDYAVDGSGTDTIITPDAPLVTLTGVKIGRDSSNPSSTLDPTDVDVLVYYDNGMIVRTDGGLFPRYRKYVLLSYTAGWTSTTVPDQVKTAMQTLTAFHYRSRGREAVSNETLAGMINWSKRAMLDAPGVKEMLAAYQRPVIASLWV